MSGLDQDLKYPEKIDIFDCGIVFFEILLGKKYKPHNSKQLFHEDFVIEVCEHIDSLAIDEDIKK